MSLVNCLVCCSSQTLFILLHLMFYSYTIKTDPQPFAVAINVPRNQCEGSFNHSKFLTRDNTKTVKDAIYKNDSHFYKGNDLIAAGPCPLKDCKINPVCYLLQNESSSFNELLYRRTNSCVVIYSVYYPCQNMSGRFNITLALGTLKNPSGIKAFVFSKVCLVGKNDHTCSDLANCTEIVKYVPLYRFVNKAVSKQCQWWTTLSRNQTDFPIYVLNKFSNISLFTVL